MRNSSRSDGSRRFIIPSFVLIIALCVISFRNEIRLDSLFSFGRCALPNVPMMNNSSSLETSLFSYSSDEIRILIGILTLPDQYPRRHFLRLIYGTQDVPQGVKVDVKFVFCNLTKEDQKLFVALEIMRYDDIIILNCKENMNKGKTYTYFSSLPDLFNEIDSPNPPYHYVMKTDDDTYIRLESLIVSLRPLPREDLYYGFLIQGPSMDPFVHYMSGMGYLVSWDIAVWIKDSDIPKKHLEGHEDKVFGNWIREGGRGKNWFDAKWSIYNFPGPPTRFTHELWPDTIAVHNLKNQEIWITTLNYFNVSSKLKPSKLYHIP